MRTEGNTIGIFRVKNLTYVLLNGFLLAFFLTGSHAAGTSKGQTIKQSAQIMIKQDGQQSGKYTSSDLIVDYNYTADGKTLQMSGVVKAAPSLAANYSNVNRFYLGLLLADAQGKVLQREPLATYTGGKLRTGLDFKANLSLPPQAACMAFMYNGQLTGGGSGPYVFSGNPIGK
jgi:hypothetical protein